MRRSTFAKVFRVLAIVGLVPVIPNFVLKVMEAADVIGYGGDWLFWMMVDVFACTVLGLSLFVMAIAGYRKGMVLFPFRLRKLVEELTPSERLEYHSRTMAIIMLPAISGWLLADDLHKGMRRVAESHPSHLTWLISGLYVACLAVWLAAFLTGIVFLVRANKLKRQEAAASGVPEDVPASADSKDEE